MQSGATQQFEIDLRAATRGDMKLLLAGELMPEALSGVLAHMPTNGD